MAENIASSIAEGNHFAEGRKTGTQTQGPTAPLSMRSWRELGMHTYIRILIIAGLFTYLFRSEISGIVRGWLTDSSWSHGFLIPLFSLYFINQHRGEILGLQYARDPLAVLLHGRRPEPLLPGQTRPDYLGLFFLICALMFYLFNMVSPSGYAYFRSISMIASLGAVVLFLGGWRLIKYTWLPIAFLVFAVPLPGRFYVQVTMPMRILAARMTTTLMNLVSGMDATVNGVVIDVIYKGRPLEPSLNVAEACSGMRLLMAFLALGVAMAYLHYRPIWQRIILLASTIPIAIFCNIVRVTVTGFIYVLADPRYAQGIYHDILGMAMLPLAFGLYGLIAWFMSSLFIEEAEVSSSDVSDIVVRRRERPES